MTIETIYFLAQVAAKSDAFPIIPAQAGIQLSLKLDPGFRRGGRPLKGGNP